MDYTLFFEGGRKRMLFTGVKFESTTVRCREFKDCGFKVSSYDNQQINGFLSPQQTEELRKHIEETGHTVYVTHAMTAKKKIERVDFKEGNVSSVTTVEE